MKMTIVNMPVLNTRTDTIHWGTVNTETQSVTAIHCGKPVSGQYRPAKGKQLTCQVCRTKLTGISPSYYRRLR